MKNIQFKLLSFTLILLMLTSVYTAVQPSVIVHADVIELIWLVPSTDPYEIGYLNGVIAKYEALNPNVHIIIIGMAPFMILQEIIGPNHLEWHPDMISFYALWLPLAANHVSEYLTPAPADIVADVTANWQSKYIEPATYKSLLYGYPTECDCWSLVYNRKLFQDAIDAGQTQLTPILNKLEHRDANGVPDQPLTWAELSTAGIALTTWDTSVSPPKIIQTGFAPMSLAAQGRFQFLSLLWSNGGEYYDLSVPEVLFDTSNGYEAMQFLSDLGYVEPRAYDPQDMPDFWWTAWTEETVGMMMLPTWMNYIVDAMGANFEAHLGVAPIPIGPSGTESVSNSYCWMVGVTQKAQDEGKAAAAWDFLKWLHQPRPAGYIESPQYMPESYGPVPKGEGCSIMGDFLIFDDCIPSKIADQVNGRIYDPTRYGVDILLPITADPWRGGYMNIANTYGRPTADNLKSIQIDAEINLMFDRIIITGANPTVEVREAALRVQDELPMSGDVNLDGIVDIFDVPFLIADIDATPTSPNWHRGRSDFNDDDVVNVLDITIFSVNYGRSW